MSFSIVLSRDQLLLQLIKKQLHSYTVDTPHTIDDLFTLLKIRNPLASVYLDIPRPKRDDYDFVRDVRGETASPIIIITSVSGTWRQEFQKVGATDIVPHPINQMLHFFVDGNQRKIPQITIGNVGNQLVFSSGLNSIRVEPDEFRLAQFLIQHPNEIYSADELIDIVWGPGTPISKNDVLLCFERIRQKTINLDSEVASRFVFRRNKGYLYRAN